MARLQPSATASEGIDVVARGGSTKAIDNWERLVSFKVACELPCSRYSKTPLLIERHASCCWGDVTSPFRNALLLTSPFSNARR